MTKTRKVDSTAGRDPLPVRTTPRKRKLVDYSEADDNNGILKAESDDAVNDGHGDGTVNPPKGRKTALTASHKASTTGARRAKAVDTSSGAHESSTITAKSELANGTVKDAVAKTVTTKRKSTKSKASSKSDTRQTDTQGLDPELSDNSSTPSTATSPKAKRKRKTQADKNAAMIPLAARSTGLKYFVGAHTSIAKGVENAIFNANHIGANAFACFLKSQRKWDNPALQPASISAWNATLQTHPYDLKNVVPHGSYLVNLASADPEMNRKSYAAFLDDLKRCEMLGIKYYNFHPGSAGQFPLDEAIQRLASNLNKALSATTSIVPVLENMASRGNIIGGRFSDLALTIALIKPEHRHRIGVCIDTCHAFASGYDLRTPAAFQNTMSEFDNVVGMKYLKAVHLNDSKAPLASGRDLHQNIGVGFLGLRAFHNIMNDSRFQNIPLVLETPCEVEVEVENPAEKDDEDDEDGPEEPPKDKTGKTDGKGKESSKPKPKPKPAPKKKSLEDKSIWAREIKLLESLIGMDPDSDTFKSLERDLSEKGREEREKMQKTFDEKIAKEKRKREKGQKDLREMFGGSGGGNGGGGKKGGGGEEAEGQGGE